MRLLGGAPNSSAFTAGANFALAALKQLDHGYVQLADLSLTISGQARSPEAYESLEALKTRVPTGITLAALTVTPPIASPYVWRASFDGARLTIEGNVPAADFGDKLRGVVPPTIPVELHLQTSSGEPAGFDDKAMSLLKSLLALQSGQAGISDTTITLSGAPPSQEVADEVTAQVTAAGGTATLEPPQVGDYSLSIAKSGTALVFNGFAPDKTTRDKLAALPGADVANLNLGRGAPAHFSEALKFGLEALAHLTTGQVDLKGTHLGIGGTAATRDDYKSLTAMLASPPEGVEIVAGALHAPAVSPFVWSATKAADGAISTAGYLPDDATRSALAAKIATPGADTAELAEGAPEDFARSAGKGLDILALLDTGKLAFDGTSWSIEGTVDSLKKSFAADAAYSIAGLRTAGWTYTVHAPALPQVSPYLWRAQKAADGAINVSGYAPDDVFGQSVKTKAPGVADATTLAAGAPADFTASALAGIDALNALKDGNVAFDGTHWNSRGQRRRRCHARHDPKQALRRSRQNQVAGSDRNHRGRSARRALSLVRDQDRRRYCRARRLSPVGSAEGGHGVACRQGWKRQHEHRRRRAGWVRGRSESRARRARAPRRRPCDVRRQQMVVDGRRRHAGRRSLSSFCFGGWHPGWQTLDRDPEWLRGPFG